METSILVAALVSKIVDAMKGLPISSYWFPIISIFLGALLFPLWTGHFDRVSILGGIEAGAAAIGIYEAAKGIAKSRKEVDTPENLPQN